MSRLSEFKEFYLKVVLPNTLSYKNYLNEGNFDKNMNDLIKEQQSHFASKQEIYDLKQQLAIYKEKEQIEKDINCLDVLKTDLQTRKRIDKFLNGLSKEQQKEFREILTQIEKNATYIVKLH